MSDNEMYVVKRDGEKEEVSFDKILRRIKTLGKDANLTSVNYSSLCLKVIDQLYDGIPTTKLDELAAEQCASMNTIHYDYGTLASRISLSNLHKKTSGSFFSVAKMLFEHDLLSGDVWSVLQENLTKIENAIDYQRDFLIDYFGFN